MDVDWRCNNNNDQVYPRDVAPPRLGEGVLPRDSCGFSGRWGPAWRCLAAKCFNGNNGDEEKPRKTSKMRRMRRRVWFRLFSALAAAWSFSRGIGTTYRSFATRAAATQLRRP